MITKDISSQPTNISRCSAASNGMRILMLSTDSNIFEKDSAVRARMIEYGALVRRLDIIILSKNKTGQQELSPNVIAHAAHSRSKLMALCKAIRIGGGVRSVDLVTAQDPFETGFAAWRISRRLGVPLELQAHTDFMSPYFAKENIKNKIRVILARFLLPRADCVRVVSERIKKSIHRLTHAPIVVLPIFTDALRFQNVDGSAVRSQFPQFEKIILMVSRLEPEKNVVQAIEAFEMVIKKNPKSGLIIVGGGGEKDKLLKEIKNRKLEASSILVGAQKNIAPYYARADAYLQTSLYEGYGLALMEAYAAGLPIVTTDVGVAGELVSGEGVFVCPVGDGGCLAAAIEQALLANRRFTRKLAEISKEAYLLAYKKQWESCYLRS